MCFFVRDQPTKILRKLFMLSIKQILMFFFTLLAVTNSTSILPAFTTVVIVYARKKVSEKKLSRSRKISVSDKLCSTKKNIPHKFFISESNSHTREIWIWDFGRMEVVSHFFLPSPNIPCRAHVAAPSMAHSTHFSNF